MQHMNLSQTLAIHQAHLLHLSCAEGSITEGSCNNNNKKPRLLGSRPVACLLMTFQNRWRVALQKTIANKACWWLLIKSAQNVSLLRKEQVSQTVVLSQCLDLLCELGLALHLVVYLWTSGLCSLDYLSGIGLGINSLAWLLDVLILLFELSLRHWLSDWTSRLDPASWVGTWQGERTAQMKQTCMFLVGNILVSHLTQKYFQLFLGSVISWAITDLHFLFSTVGLWGVKRGS